MTAFAEPTLHQGLLPTLCTNGLWCNSSNWLLFWKGLPHSVLCLERQKYQVFKIAIEFFDYKWAANISAWFSNLSHSELFQVLQKLSCSIRSVYIPLPSSREYGRSFVRSKLRSKWFWEYDRVWASWLLQKASTRLTEETNSGWFLNFHWKNRFNKLWMKLLTSTRERGQLASAPDLWPCKWKSDPNTFSTSLQCKYRRYSWSVCQ